MKSIRFIALISAAAMCFGLCACGKSEKKDEIAVPILETKDITYKTVKAEIGNRHLQGKRSDKVYRCGVAL